MSDGKISNDEPLETLANILEAIIDTILYGSTGVKTEKLSSFATPLFVKKIMELFSFLGVK